MTNFFLLNIQKTFLYSSKSSNLKNIIFYHFRQAKMYSIYKYDVKVISDFLTGMYLPIPSHEQDVTQGQFFEFNRSEFRVFLLLDWLSYLC